jgi:single-strand DNA-binding protein
MSATLNRYLIIGIVGADPDYRAMPNGVRVATFNVATQDAVDGKLVTEWTKVAAFGDQADRIRSLVKAKRWIWIMGPAYTRTWIDRQNVRRETKEIHLLSSWDWRLLPNGVALDDVPTPPRTPHQPRRRQPYGEPPPMPEMPNEPIGGDGNDYNDQVPWEKP